LVMLLWSKGVKAQENLLFGRFFVFFGSVSMYLFAIHGFIRYPFVSLANNLTNPFYTILIGLFYFATILILSIGVKILMDYLRSKTSDFLIQLRGMRFYEKFHSKIIIGSFQWLRFFWVLVVFHFVMRLVEFLFGKYLGALVAIDFMDYYAVALSYDTIAMIVFSLFWYLVFVISTFFSKSLGTIINYMVVLLYALGSTLLIGYFFYSRVPLDHSLFSYTIAESFAIAGSSGFPSVHDFILFGIVICLLILLFKWIRIGKNFMAGWVVLGTGLLLFVSSVSLIQKPADAKDESTFLGSVNKLHLFVSSCFTRLTVNNEYNASNESVVKAFKRYKHGSEKLFFLNLLANTLSIISAVPYPWVQMRIEHIHKEMHKEEHRNDCKHTALDHRQIPGRNRVHEQASYPWPGKDLFNHNSPSKQASHLKTNNCDNR